MTLNALELSVRNVPFDVILNLSVSEVVIKP
jgi:hypothetical protein